MERTLGRSGIPVSALGIGTWAIGGPFTVSGFHGGWGAVDPAESLRALDRAIGLGVRLIDTADAYGVGDAERLVGRAIAGRRDDIVIVTKFGNTFDEASRTLTGTDLSPAYVRRACEASLRRMGLDAIDVLLLHVEGVPLNDVRPVRDTLEALVVEGKIRGYGWSTISPEEAAFFAEGPGCVAVEHEVNVLTDAPEMFAVAERENLASLNRAPLGMGLLTGKFAAGSRVAADDVRGQAFPWMRFFTDGRPDPVYLDRLAAVREVLRSDGRTLAQGALAWLWARSPQAIPIPGFKTAAQIEENAGAMAHGPLRPEQMDEIATLLIESGPIAR